MQREQARARRDYKAADVLRDQLEKHGVYLDPKENKWHSADGRTGAILVSTLSDDEIGKILASRQAARLRHDYKAAPPVESDACPVGGQRPIGPPAGSHGPAAPTDPRAQPERLGGLPWPQQLASACLQDEDSSSSTPRPRTASATC